MRLRAMDIVALALAIVAWAGSACAADRDCTSGALAGTEDFPVFRVREGIARLHFVASPGAAASGCPSAADHCRTSAFVVAGDEVLVTWPAVDGFVCAHYVSPQGRATSGWLDKAALRIQGDSMLPFGSVEAYGTWANGLAEASIRIQPGGPGYILVEGEATRGPPSYNTGSFGGPAYTGEGPHGPVAGYTGGHYRGETPAGAAAAPDSGGCRIRFRFAGHYLLVDDNGACGGHGVTFSGVYARRSAAAGRR